MTAVALAAAVVAAVFLLIGREEEEFVYQGRPYRAYLPELAFVGTSSTYLEARRVVHEAGAQGLPTLRAVIHRGEPWHVRYFLHWQARIPPRLRIWLHQRIKPYEHQNELRGAFNAVALLGKDAAPLARELGRQFERGNVARRSEVAQVLPGLGPAAVEIVLPYLTDADLRTRSLAAYVIHELGPQATNGVDSLLAGLAGADSNHLNLVSQTLARMGPAVLPQVRVLLASTNTDHRMVAIGCLNQLLPRARELTPELVNLLHDRSPEVRFATAGILTYWWGSPLAERRQQLREPPGDQTAHARFVASLTALKEAEATLLAVLREGLADADARRRLDAASRLVQLQLVDAEVVAVLEELPASLEASPAELAGLTNLLLQARALTTNAGVSVPDRETRPRPDRAPAGQSRPSTGPRPVDKSP